MTRDSFFTDLHNHIIFSVDDGPEIFDNSIRMIEQAFECNIRQIATTPHINDLTDELVIDRIKENFDQIINEIQKRNIPVNLLLAAELNYSDKIYRWLEETWVTLNGNKKYFLFELPLFVLPDGVSDFIFKVKLAGFEPILAHPERYIYLHKNVDRLIQWHRQGCLMQMNAGSLTGQFGNEVSSMTKKMLSANFYSFVASDAHDIESRNFKVLQKAYEISEGLVNHDILENLFKINPDKAIKGETISQTLINENILKENWLGSLVRSIKKFKLH
jgi:protein-tyrosine phosphatase